VPKKVTHCTRVQSTPDHFKVLKILVFLSLDQTSGQGSSDGKSTSSSSNGQGSGISSSKGSGSISSSCDGGSSDSRGSSCGITDMLDRLGNTYGDLLNSVDRGVDGGGDLLDRVGTGLVHKGLADGLVGTDGALDSLTSEGGDVLEDGLSDMGGFHNRGGLMGSNGGGDMCVGGLSDGVGDGGDLGGNLGKSMSLGSGVGKVASKSVVLDGSRVMGGGPDQEGGRCCDWGSRSNGTGGDSYGGCSAESDEAGEKQEGVHCGGC